MNNSATIDIGIETAIDMCGLLRVVAVGLAIYAYLYYPVRNLLYVRLFSG